MNVLETNTGLPFEMLQKIRALSNRELNHDQFRIICRCKGVADANRKCQVEGLGDSVFAPGWTSISGNKTELTLCEQEDIWVRVGDSDKYVSLHELK